MDFRRNAKVRYSELTVIQNEGAAVETEAVVHRKLNALGISHPFLIAPECILPEAFEDEQGCMQRQLAALFEVPIAEIAYEFTLLRQGWERRTRCEFAPCLLRQIGHEFLPVLRGSP